MLTFASFIRSSGLVCSAFLNKADVTSSKVAGPDGPVHALAIHTPADAVQHTQHVCVCVCARARVSFCRRSYRHQPLHATAPPRRTHDRRSRRAYARPRCHPRAFPRPTRKTNPARASRRPLSCQGSSVRHGQSTADAEHWKGDTGGKRDLSTKNFATFSSAPVVSMNCRTASPSVAIALPHRLTCIFIAKRI